MNDRVAQDLLRGDRFVIPYEDRRFPEALRQIEKPPDILYLIGNPAALSEGLAIVGARKATPYGTSCAKRFARLAAQRGITIISGGARGCDAAAHRAALDAHGKTVVFLGGGCDRLYPAAHLGLFQDVVDGGGAVVSEHEWDFPPLRHTFRARNRLIAGLAKATLIVEAGLPSGTFSTADEALAANREVLVVPGSIASSNSRGTNRLLFQGAIPIIDDESFLSILDALFLSEESVRIGESVQIGDQQGEQMSLFDAGALSERSPERNMARDRVSHAAASTALHTAVRVAPQMVANLERDATEHMTKEVHATKAAADKTALAQGSATAATQESDPVLDALSATPMHVDELISTIAEKPQAMLRDTDRPEIDQLASVVLAHLAELESTGHAVRYPDGRYGVVLV